MQQHASNPVISLSLCNKVVLFWSKMAIVSTLSLLLVKPNVLVYIIYYNCKGCAMQNLLFINFLCPASQASSNTRKTCSQVLFKINSRSHFLHWFSTLKAHLTHVLTQEHKYWTQDFRSRSPSICHGLQQ